MTDYKQRTWNVRDADGTLILACGEPTGGTATTIKLATAYGNPCLMLDLLASTAPAVVRDWLIANRITVLNVAGPRESRCQGIHEQTTGFIYEIF